MKAALIILIAFLLIDCRNENLRPVDNEILLVNAGNANREEIATAIDRLAKCGAKIIGVNLIFKDQQSASADLHLAESIKNAGNVVLVSIINGNKIVSSNELFTAGALAQGPHYYGMDGDSAISEQMIYISLNDDLVWSLPATLASYFDVENMDRIMKNTKGNRFYEIQYKNDFTVIDIRSEFDCGSISGNLVIIGYLGPGEEDLQLTRLGEKRYATWILANCVRDIRDGDQKLIGKKLF
jgi:hypothetical protein